MHLQSDPNFPTDREISNRELRERELERWKASDEDDMDSEKLTLKVSRWIFVACVVVVLS